VRSSIFFGGWGELAATAITAVLAYAALVGLLRVSGKRTLSKMNAFDFVVTIALGSTLATIILSADVSIAQGALAFALLIGLQFIVTWLSVRIPTVRRAITGEPSLLFYRGVVLHDAMKKARVTDDELMAAMRSAGVTSFADIEAIVLETDASFSVIRRSAGGGSALSQLRDDG